MPAPVAFHIARSDHIARSCSTKNRYHDEQGAVKAMHHTVLRGHDDERSHGMQIGTYKCGYCHGWHVGHCRT